MEQIPIQDRPDNVVPFSLTPDRPEEAEVPWDDLGPEPEAEEPEPPAAPSIGPMVEQSARIVAGFLSAVATATAAAVRAGTPSTSAPDDELPDEDAPAPAPSQIGVAAGAAAGLAMEVTQASVRAASAFAESAGPMLSWFTNAAVVRTGIAGADGRIQELNRRWEQERVPAEEAASAFAGAVIPRIVDAALERIDLDRILERVDLNAIIERVDVNAIIDRVDLAGLAEEVISEIDLPEIIRGSTTAVTSETVRSVRVQSAEGDQAIARLVDRILRRDGERDTDTRADGR